MPTSRLQNRRLAGIGNRINLAQQGRNRLEAHSQLNIHAVRYAALYAPGMIRLSNDTAAFARSKFIYHLRTATTTPRKSHTELNALNCRD